jgi:hypothetical protein
LVHLGCQPGEQVEVGQDLFLEVRFLDFYRDFPTIVQAGEMNLRERGGGGGGFLKGSEQVGKLAAQLIDEDGFEFVEGQGLHFILQLAQLQHQRMGEQVRPHAEQLAGLDEGGPQLFRGKPDTFEERSRRGGFGDEARPDRLRQLDLVEQIGEPVPG